MNALCSIHVSVALVVPASVGQEELFSCLWWWGNVLGGSAEAGCAE